ncbi:MAG TPA: hypothetical protein VFA41_07420 [Ktedonobacteraceae bacterium]|nr:hypothetical protein [Ktedonobacteraceae bacterium]
MRTFAPITKRVDHIMIRVVDTAYEQLFSLFTETLQLPITWAVNNYIPSFKTGGVFAGNMSMEIFASGSRSTLDSPVPSQAQLYGIAFEPFSLANCKEELDKRGLTHTDLLPVPPAQRGTMGAMWTMVYLTNLLECNPSMAGGDITAPDASGLTPLFDVAYPNGMIFYCEYTPTFYDTTKGLLVRQVELNARQGGPLGLQGTQEIVIGVQDIESARENWQKFFAPTIPVRPDAWQVGDGPAIHLVPAEKDGLLRLVWKVNSLERAKAFLQGRNLLGECGEHEVRMDIVGMLGLDIGLVE